MRPQATFSFFIFLQLFHFSTLLIAPSSTSQLSSSSILPPRPSFLLVPPSSTSLFLPRPALSKSFSIRKRPVFIDLDESVTDGPTDRPTNGRTDKASYRDARTHLKMDTPFLTHESKNLKRIMVRDGMCGFFVDA